MVSLFILVFNMNAQKGVIKTKLSDKKLIQKSKTLPKPFQIISVPAQQYPFDKSNRNNANSSTPASWPFTNLPHQHTSGHQNCNHNAGFCDP